MSLILDALHKADKERQPASTQSYMPLEPMAAQKTPKKMAWRLMIILWLLTLSVVFLLLIVERHKAPQPTHQHSAIEQPVSQPVSQPVPQTSQTGKSSLSAAADPDQLGTQIKSDNETENNRLDSAPALVPAPTEKMMETEAEQEKAQLALIAKQYETAKAPSGAADNTQVSALYQQQPAKAETPKADARTAPQQDKRLGGIRSLPSRIQDELPSLRYTEHNPSSGSVRINGKTLTVGSALSDDLILEEIRQDGVILRFKGYRFVLGAFSSWVNM